MFCMAWLLIMTLTDIMTLISLSPGWLSCWCQFVGQSEVRGGGDVLTGTALGSFTLYRPAVSATSSTAQPAVTLILLLPLSLTTTGYVSPPSLVLCSRLYTIKYHDEILDIYRHPVKYRVGGWDRGTVRHVSVSAALPGSPIHTMLLRTELVILVICSTSSIATITFSCFSYPLFDFPSLGFSSTSGWYLNLSSHQSEPEWLSGNTDPSSTIHHKLIRILYNFRFISQLRLQYIVQCWSKQ